MSVFANKEDRRQLRGIIAAMLVEPDTLRTKATRHANAPSGGKGQKKTFLSLGKINLDAV